LPMDSSPTDSMSWSAFWNGPLGAVFLYAMLLVILAMTFIISFRLLVNRRKIGYLSMVLAIFIMIVQNVQIIIRTLWPIDSDMQYFIELSLKMLSFLLLHLGIYQLYNVTRKRDAFVLAVIGVVSLGVALSYWYLPGWLDGVNGSMRLVQSLGIELYMFLLIFSGFLLVNPRIGQNGKYQVLLTLAFFNQTIHMIDVYLLKGEQPTLRMLGIVASFVCHTVLFLLIFERIIEIMQAIYNSSIKDELTKLYNRKYFYQRVNQHVRMREPVSVIFIDIDNFKKLNDTKGHHTGDEVLMQVSHIVREETEDIGICGRYGGEEIVVLIVDPETDPRAVAERIRARVEAETVVTVSMGSSKLRKGQTADDLIKLADEAMYQAKTTGKNKIVTL